MQNRLLSIYIKQLNPPINIYGLILHPQIVDDSIKWTMKNPNDLPYNIGVINGHLEELLYNFMRTTGTKDLPMWDNCYEQYCRLDGNPNQKYVNKVSEGRPDVGTPTGSKAKTANLISPHAKFVH
jgi:hypothetical protein